MGTRESTTNEERAEVLRKRTGHLIFICPEHGDLAAYSSEGHLAWCIDHDEELDAMSPAVGAAIRREQRESAERNLAAVMALPTRMDSHWTVSCADPTRAGSTAPHDCLGYCGPLQYAMTRPCECPCHEPANPRDFDASLDRARRSFSGGRGR